MKEITIEIEIEFPARPVVTISPHLSLSLLRFVNQKIKVNSDL